MDCQFISIYGKFVTSLTAYFSRADNIRRMGSLSADYCYHGYADYCYHRYADYCYHGYADFCYHGYADYCYARYNYSVLFSTGGITSL